MSLPERLFGRWFDNIVVYLGLPLIAFALNAAHVVGVKWRPGPGSMQIDGVVQRWRPALWARMTLAFAMCTIVAIIVACDHLCEMVGR